MAYAQPARVFRFGPFEADLGNRQLFKDGVPVSLTGQPFEVLALLLEHPGQLVTRDQMRTRLWPTGTVVEFEHSITVAITKLREVLGDKSQDSRFIATVPRHGYRFIAPVSTTALAALESRSTPSLETSLPTHSPAAPQHERRRKWIVIAMLAVLIVGLAYVFVSRLWILRHPVAVQSAVSGTQELTARAASSTTAAPFHPPPHSIAVVPFVNISGDKEQEYFSDGLTEELLSALSRVNELQVAAQTSSFYFKGKNVDLGTIARKLNVGAVLEGSVRRSVHRVRVTAQLIDAVTGYHLWSETYDRDLGDVLALQTDIANSVAGALKVTLLGHEAARIELGGTRNPAALDAYLKAANAHFTTHNEKADEPIAIAAYSEAIRLDPNYALAFTGRSIALGDYSMYVTEKARRDARDKALADAQRAIAVAPDLAEAHLALAVLAQVSLDFAEAAPEYRRALDLAPGNARVLRDYGNFAVTMGWTEAGMDALRRARILDPLNRDVYTFLGGALGELRRYDESIAAYRELLKVDPDYSHAYTKIGWNYFMLGDFQSALSWCKAKQEPYSSVCLAVTYDRLGRHPEAESALAEFTASSGGADPYVVAEVYAQWGNTGKAFEWLEKAMRVRDSSLEILKIDPFLDPLRKDPRFQAIERELRFPD